MFLAHLWKTGVSKYSYLDNAKFIYLAIYAYLISSHSFIQKSLIREPTTVLHLDCTESKIIRFLFPHFPLIRLVKVRLLQNLNTLHSNRWFVLLMTSVEYIFSILFSDSELQKEFSERYSGKTENLTQKSQFMKRQNSNAGS